MIDTKDLLLNDVHIQTQTNQQEELGIQEEQKKGKRQQKEEE